MAQDAKKTAQDQAAEEIKQEITQAQAEQTEAEVTVEKKTAKAGKRSAKAIAETEEKQAKEARKAQTAEAEAEEKPKQAQKPARSRAERRGKAFRKVAEQVDSTKQYSLKDAMALAAKTSPVKFDATVEMHINLAVDPRHADQNVRDTLVLPAGTGKTVRIAVFADAAAAADAKKAGADIAGEEEITKLLDKESLDFDVLIATPTHMAKLGKYARMLGPRGLMPNPKSGTVTPNVVKAVSEAKAGRVEYRVDSTGIVHLGIGKVSFGADKLLSNAETVMASIRAAKPASVKNTYIKAIHVTTTMGPSITVNQNEA